MDSNPAYDLKRATKICIPFLQKTRNDFNITVESPLPTYIPSENVTKGPWEQSIGALHRTLSYVYHHLHHPCYFLCVGSDGSIETFFKLKTPKTTADVFHKALTEMSRGKGAKMEGIIAQRDLRVMQCIIKRRSREDATFSAEYRDFLKGSLKLSQGVYLLNLTDAVILHKRGIEPFTMITGEMALPQEYAMGKTFLPILSTSGSIDHWDIPIPNYDDILLPSQKAVTSSFVTDWDKKSIEKAVFRGGPTGCGRTVETNARLKAATMSVGNGDILDAGIVGGGDKTRVASSSLRVDPVEGLGYLEGAGLKTVGRLSMQEQSQYKYILHIDGNVHAYRLLTTMLTGSLILRVESPYTGWLDSMLVPGTHYLPVKGDLSNLKEVIEDCQKSDAKCREVARNGLELALQVVREGYMESALQKICLNLPRLLEGADAETAAETADADTAPMLRKSALATAALETNRARGRDRTRLELTRRRALLRCAPLVRAPRFKDNAQLSLPSPLTPTDTLISPVAAKDPSFIMKKTATERCPKNYVVDKKDKMKCVHVGPRTRKRSVAAETSALPLTEKATKGRSNTKTRKTPPS